MLTLFSFHEGADYSRVVPISKAFLNDSPLFRPINKFYYDSKLRNEKPRRSEKNFESSKTRRKTHNHIYSKELDK